MPNVVNQGYRPLTEAEIAALKDHANSADDWAQVWVKEDFVPKYILNTHFSGWVRLGLFEKTFDLPGGISKHSGLYYTYLHNVEVGDNCCIEHVNNYIANYTIGEETFISNVDTILVQGETTFGNGVEVSVLNETGGREVLSYDQLSAHEAYFMAMYRHRPELIQRLRQLIMSYIDGLRSSHGTIGSHAHITDVGNITNVKIGLMGPVAGIGDPIFWGTARPVLAALGASLALNGSFLGPLLFFVGINVLRVLTRWYGLKVGYERGTTLVTEVGGGQLKKITQMAAIMGLFVMGALVSQWTKIYFPLVVSKVEDRETHIVTTTTLQDVLNQLLPGLAALGLTFLCMWLLNKKVNALWIILGMFVIGILGRWAHVLGVPGA